MQYDDLELERVARAAGVDPSGFKSWLAHPDVEAKYAGSAPSQLVGVFKQGQEAVKQAQTGQMDLAKVAAAGTPVTVSSQRSPIPTTVNPYAGTTQEAAAGDTGNPNASAISQFDPAAMKGAQEAYNKFVADTQGSRTLANILAGFGAGTTSGGTSAFNELMKKEQLQKAFDQTIGAQERLQKQATEGQSALTSAQAREEAAGKFTGTQREMQQKLELGQFTVEQQKRLNSPSSAETMAAKSLLLSQLASIPTAARAEIQKIISDPNVTAVSIMPIMAQYAPAAHKSYLDQIGAGKTVAETGLARAQSGLTVQQAGKVAAEIPGVAATSDITKATAGTIVSPDGKLIPMPGTNMTIQAGGTSIAPSSGTISSQNEVAKDQGTTRQQSTHFTTNIQDPAEKLLSVVQNNAGTGLLAKTPSSWGNTPADVAQKAVNKIVAEEAAMNGREFRQADAEALFKGGPAVVADYVINMKAEQARRNAKLAMQEQFQKENNGTLQGFNPAPLANMKPLYNPVTRQVQLLTPGTPAWDNAIKDKWVPSETGYYFNKYNKGGR